MDAIKKENLLNYLSKIFLKYRDMDEGYFKVLRKINRLKNKGIYIDINKIQSISYNCKEVK